MRECEQLQRVNAEATEQMLKSFELEKYLGTEEFNKENK